MALIIENPVRVDTRRIAEVFGAANQVIWAESAPKNVIDRIRYGE